MRMGVQLVVNFAAKYSLTDLGKAMGEFRTGQYGVYFLWNENTEI